MTKHIQFIVGSLRTKSLNKQLGKYVEQQIRQTVDVSFLNYEMIPYMNQDLEQDVPKSIQTLRSQIQEADGIWIFTPEYNRSYPGVLKNLLDWLSRPLTSHDYTSVLTRKKVTLSSVAGNSGGQYVLAQLNALCTFVQMDVHDVQTGITASKEIFARDVLELNETQKEQVDHQIASFLEYLQF